MFGDRCVIQFRGYRINVPKQDGEEPYGGLAQLGERLPCTQEVTGSIPVLSTMKRLTELAFERKLIH